MQAQRAHHERANPRLAQAGARDAGEGGGGAVCACVGGMLAGSRIPLIPIPIDASPSGVAPALPTAEPCRASLCVQATLRPTAAHPRAAAAAATRTRRTATRSGRRSRRGRRPGRWCGRRQRYAKNNACLLELAGLKRECQAVKRGWQVTNASSPLPPPPPAAAASGGAAREAATAGGGAARGQSRRQGWATA